MNKYIKTKSDLPLGASYNDKTDEVEFRLESKSASDVVLCIFKKPVGDIPFLEINMQKTEDIFYASVKKKKAFKYGKTFWYAYRVFGKNFPKSREYKPGSDIGFVSRLTSDGDRFNPNKLAYDPYSIELSHCPSSVSSDMTAFRSGGGKYLLDNAKIAPKTAFKIIKEQKIRTAPKRAFKDEIVAEVHVKDLTRLIKTDLRGTYKAAARFAKFIKQTGVTMVEFLPLHEFDSYADKENHWGYMSLNYFAVKKQFSSSKEPYGALYEFRGLIDEFHKNGIKVCMDVVYNHTGEAKTYGDNEDANLFSYALIDNRHYYKLAQNAHYTNHSGCGNDLNTVNKITADLIINSISFWINQGVDAFRFDLAVALMDTSASGYEMYDKNGGMLQYVKKRLEDAGHKINLTYEDNGGVNFIAEPWMCSGAYNYQLGNFPDYFAEWNDITRDTIRAISIRPDNVNPYAIKNVIEGCPQRFSLPSRSINYVSCHDGYSLFDLNTFDKPNPETKGGFVGEMCSSYQGNKAEQDNAVRKQILILMISSGIPMIQFGDIFLHSKAGNNNSYNLDDKTNWINYKLDKRKENLSLYIKNLIKFRKENPVFSKTDYVSKIEYYYPSGAKVNDYDESYWKNNASNIICFKVNDEKCNYYIAISKDKNKIKLTLPLNSKNKKRYLIADTKKDFINLKGALHKNLYYELEPFGACIFTEK